MTPPDRPAPTPESQAALDEVTAISQELGLYDRPAQPTPDLDALFEAFAVQNPNGYWQHTLYHEASDPVAMPDSVVRVVVMRADAIATLRAQLAEAQAMSQKYQIAYGEEQDGRHREFNRANALKARVAELEAALKNVDGWLPIALCPTDGVWRLVKLSDGNEAVAAFDGVGLLSKKRWQTKVFLTHRPASPSPINDLVMQQACDVFLIADLENGVYPTHFRPNDTVFGLPALKGAAT